MPFVLAKDCRLAPRKYLCLEIRNRRPYGWYGRGGKHWIKRTSPSQEVSRTSWRRAFVVGLLWPPFHRILGTVHGAGNGAWLEKGRLSAQLRPRSTCSCWCGSHVIRHTAPSRDTPCLSKNLSKTTGVSQTSISESTSCGA